MKYRMNRSILLGLTIILWMTLLGDQIIAQGFIIPRPVPPHHPTMPQLTEHKVDVKIVDQVAQVEVSQVFHNQSSFAIEGNYYFPLPKDASVSDFKMYADGKVLSGELLERDKARQIYEDIVRRNIDPALLEYADHNLFSAKIFPIPPQKDRKIVLRYASLLKLEGELVQFSYPLRGQFQSERFVRPARPIMPQPIPQDQQEGDNQSTDNARRKHVAEISQVIVVDLNSKIPLKNIYSPSHRIDISRSNEHQARISFEGKRQESEDNFVLYYSFSQSDLGLNILTYQPDAKDEKNFFMLLISPKTEIDNKEIQEKDMVFILDVSGSMSGEKIDQARAALKYCVEHLDSNDRFNLITFSTESNLFKKELLKAADYRSEALSFIEKIEAKGGTNINEALLNALELKFDRQRPVSLVFITDGLPTIGETDIGKIVSNVLENNQNKIKIFTFGVGYDVNTVLLDKIAATNGAVSDYIEPKENIEQKVASFYDKIRHPILTDLAIDFGEIEIEDVYPKKLPDLFKGSQLTVLGRYKQGKRETLALTGRIKDKQKRFSYDADFNLSRAEYDFIPYLWATRKIGYLIDEIRLHGENKELKDEIVRLSKKYGVMSPYTSFLVQEEEPLAFRPHRVEPSPVMLNAPASYSQEAVFQEFRGVDGATEQGKLAVQMSKKSRAMKEAEAPPPSQLLKRIAGRLFYLKSEYWTDSEYQNEKTIDLQYGSPAYTNLILTYPELAKIAALGEKVIFKFKNKYIRISEQGIERATPAELKKILQ